MTNRQGTGHWHAHCYDALTCGAKALVNTSFHHSSHQKMPSSTTTELPHLPKTSISGCNYFGIGSGWQPKLQMYVCNLMYGNHNQLVLQEVIDSLTVIHTRVIAIISVLGVCVTLTFERLIGRTSPSNHIINKTWERNGLFLKSGILVLRHS